MITHGTTPESGVSTEQAEEEVKRCGPLLTAYQLITADGR